MSFTMPLSQYLLFVHYHVGAADGPALIWPEVIEAAVVCFLTSKEWSVGVDILHHFLVLLSLRKNLPLYLLR